MSGPLPEKRQISTATSYAFHIGFRCVSGNFGWLIGVQSFHVIIRSVNRKFRNRKATRRSCLKSFWKVSLVGKVFQAIVSVIPVKIQLSSPSIVLQSQIVLGSFPIVLASLTCGAKCPSSFFITNYLKATFMGVVKQAVKRSAGKSGFIGNNWSFEQAASWMQFRRNERGGNYAAPPWGPPALTWSMYSFSCCSAKFLKLSTMIPALLQS